MERRKRGGWALIASILPSPLLWPAVAYLGVFYLFPVARVLSLSLLDPYFTLEHFGRLLRVPVYTHVMINTFEIAFVVAFICLLIGYPTAYLLATLPPRRARVLLLFIIVPFFTSYLVRNYAWIFLLGSRGVLNTVLIRLRLIDHPLPLMFNRFGVLVGMVHVLLPYLVLVLLSVMRGISPQLTRAATSLGAAPFTAFRRIYLPLSLPGIGAGFLLIFIIALGFFVTPAMLGGPHDVMITNVIGTQMHYLNWGFGAALAMVLVIVSMVAIVLMQGFFGGISLLAPGFDAPARRQSRSRVREGLMLGAIDSIMNPLWPYIPPIIGGAVFVFVFLPVLIVIPLSFSSVAYFVFPPPGFSWQWYREYFTSQVWIDSTWHSLQIGALTAGLAMIMAVPASLGIARARSRSNMVVYLLILSPLIIPAINISIGVFFFFSQLHLNGTIWGVALGHTIGSLALATIVLVAALRHFDRNLERAALSLGASPLRTTLQVTLPVLSTAVFTATFLAFLQSFDELLIALFVSGINARTLPKKMWESLQEVNPTIAAVSTLLLAFTFGVMMTLYLIQRVADRRRVRADSLKVKVTELEEVSA